MEPFTPHGLRHLYATEMLRKGAKLEVVGRILGHSSIVITASSLMGCTAVILNRSYTALPVEEKTFPSYPIRYSTLLSLLPKV
ncbi:tyrosine-type recombinase/integrase [Chloroflexota bacterium]